MRTALTLFIAMSIALACSPAIAEQRALLVGVGKYQLPDADLPGIDLDLERMREALFVMGFEDRQIKSLLDEEATAMNITRGIQTWLTDGVGPDDRVIFYFGGHGTNVRDIDGDEDDGVDEILMAHDTRVFEEDGKATVAGVISDDMLAKMIGNIKSRNIWIIVDACHSGTVTRDIVMLNRSLGNEPVYSRSYSYPGMPVGEPQFAKSIAKQASDNFVGLSAASDREQAIGNANGGFFTIGLTEAIHRYAQSGKPMNIYTLRDEAAEYIRNAVDPSKVHNPQVTGNENLAGGALRIVPLADGNGPNWRRVEEVVEAQGQPLDLRTNQSTYSFGDPVELSMTIPVDGYVNVVTVDSKDNATVLFPNRYHSNHFVKAGEFSIPTEQMTFELPASEPAGPTLVAAFLTTKPVNFYESSVGERTVEGILDVDFSSVSHTATRAIRVAAREDEAFASMVKIDVKQR